MANIASALILALFLYGRSIRFTNNALHRKLMLISFGLDLLLVIALVVFRDALGKVNMEMHWMLKIHVPIAISTVVVYGMTCWAGYQLYKGKPVRRRLQILDKIIVPARILTLITSILVQILR